jgi:hypothetical protein
METQNTVEKTNNTTPTTQVNNKKMENEENITEPKTKDDTKNIVENNTENEEKNILNQLIEKVESKTLKDNLRDHTFIKNIQE